METLLLLIDGNNLAHFLYTNLVPGQKMTPADSLRLVEHLASYARTYAGQVEVELCLDKSPGVLPEESQLYQVENLRLFAAEYPQTGDDLVIERFWFHHLSGRGSLVISNDEEILAEVGAAGGAWLRVADFVRRAGLKDPVLREPDDLPPVPALTGSPEKDRHPFSASIYYRINRDPRLNRPQAPAHKPAQVSGRNITAPPAARPQSAAPKGDQAAGTGGGKPSGGQQPPVRQKPSGGPELSCGPELLEPRQEQREAAEPPETGLESELPGQTGGETSAPETAEPYYFLNLEAWPLLEGARFLVKSFCDQHKSEVQDLLDSLDPETLDRRDLRELAELLLITCADEPDFARRGALMNRVRLALLQARGEPLSLSAMAERTGLKALGLRGKIKAKAGDWVEILEPEGNG